MVAYEAPRSIFLVINLRFAPLGCNVLATLASSRVKRPGELAPCRIAIHVDSWVLNQKLSLGESVSHGLFVKLLLDGAKTPLRTTRLNEDHLRGVGPYLIHEIQVDFIDSDLVLPQQNFDLCNRCRVTSAGSITRHLSVRCQRHEAEADYCSGNCS